MLSNLMMFGVTLFAIATPAIATPDTAIAAFPESLQGQWTDNLANCGGEDTGGMTVKAQQIQFYESYGTPKSIRTTKDGTITAELDYRGEGKTWTESNRYVISKDNKSVRVNALGQSFTLQRCAG